MRVPSDRPAKLAYGKNHVQIFNLNQGTLGIPASANVALGSAVTQTENNYVSLQQSEQAIKTLRNQVDTRFTELSQALATCLNFIDAKVQATGDESLYDLAQVEPKEKATRRAAEDVAPPPTPTKVKISLTLDGYVELKWTGKSVNTFFDVYRRLPGQADFVQIATVGSPAFVDSSIPSSTANAQYRLVARKGSATSQGTQPVQINLNPLAQAA